MRTSYACAGTMAYPLYGNNGILDWPGKCVNYLLFYIYPKLAA